VLIEFTKQYIFLKFLSLFLRNLKCDIPTAFYVPETRGRHCFSCLLNFSLTLSFCFTLIFLGFGVKFFRNKRGIDFGRLGGIAIGFWYGRVSLLADGQYLKIMESRQYHIIFLWWIVED
jgi:hypothetical protein